MPARVSQLSAWRQISRLAARAEDVLRVHRGDAMTQSAGYSCCGYAAAVLPIEPRPLARRLRKQLFEGWYLRLVDHSDDGGDGHNSAEGGAGSIAVVFGSLRQPDRSDSASPGVSPFYDSHLLVVAWDFGSGYLGSGSSTLLLEGPRVALSGGGGGRGGERGAQPAPYVRWWADGLGGMRIDGDAASLELSLPGGIYLNASLTSPRVPWDAARPVGGHRL